MGRSAVWGAVCATVANNLRTCLWVSTERAEGPASGPTGSAKAFGDSPDHDAGRSRPMHGWGTGDAPGAPGTRAWPVGSRCGVGDSRCGVGAPVPGRAFSRPMPAGADKAPRARE